MSKKPILGALGIWMEFGGGMGSCGGFLGKGFFEDRGHIKGWGGHISVKSLILGKGVRHLFSNGRGWPHGNECIERSDR